jgi:phage terminase large subunit-like protein
MGKSELAAAIALLLTCGDGEERAEVYGCAADHNQASIVFNVAADMVRMCPALSKRVKILDSKKRLVYQPTSSFYQVLSADVANKHGFNTHGVIFDELHTQPNRKLYDVMTKGSGDARMQPLYFLITTAGDNQNSICWEVHEKAKDILEGRKHDATFYPVIYGADQDDDWTDPKVWKKANPSLGITVGIDKVRDACESARQNPAEENAFRQLRLNQWVKQAVRWMPMEKWDACAFPVDPKSLEGRVCYGGLDLSSTTDITAFVLVFPPEDEEDKYSILPFFWIPEENVDLRVKRDHVNYDLWKQQGYLQTTEGNVVHYGFIESFIEELGTRYNIREIAFDRWGATQMVQNLEGLGFHRRSLRTGLQGYVAADQRTHAADAGRAACPRRASGAPLDDGQHLHPHGPGRKHQSRTRKNPRKRSTARSPRLWRSTGAMTRQATLDSTAGSGYRFFFGGSTSGKAVTDVPRCR